jgi:hypothetical protein
MPRKLPVALRKHAKRIVLILCLGAAAALVWPSDPTHPAYGAVQPLFQQSPLSPLAPAPSPAAAVETGAAEQPTAAPIQPPLVVGRPANQTSLPLVAAVLLALIAVVALAIQRRR